MIADRKAFTTGLVLMVGFGVVLGCMFLPLFNGKNTLNVLDDLYNSISKSSADYIPHLQELCGNYDGRQVSLTLSVANVDQAERIAPLLRQGGAVVAENGPQLRVTGDLGAMVRNCLADCAALFGNAGNELEKKYGQPGKVVVYDWWVALKAIEKQLTRQKMFPEAEFVGTVNKKGVECSYNYDGIEPQRISAKAGTVIFSLAFYVVYTVWYGFGFLYLFQGLGLRLEH